MIKSVVKGMKKGIEIAVAIATCTATVGVIAGLSKYARKKLDTFEEKLEKAKDKLENLEEDKHFDNLGDAIRFFTEDDTTDDLK